MKKDDYKCEDCGKKFKDELIISIWTRCKCGGRAFSTTRQAFSIGPGAKMHTTYFEPGGKKHVISDSHLKNIRSRKLQSDGRVKAR